MRLLVIEKDPLVRQWLQRQGERQDIQLLFASGTDEALAAVLDQSPDGIFLDASSSTEDTVPLWYLLRSSPHLPGHIPILLYSSSRHWQGVAEQESMAVDGVVCRPFTVDTLVRAAREVTSLRQQLAAPTFAVSQTLMYPQSCA